MLYFFNLAIYTFLTTLAMARAAMNVTIDDNDGRIIYKPAEAWSHEKSGATLDRYAQTTSYSYTANSTATLHFKGTGVWWMTYGLETSDSATVTLDGSTQTVSLNTGTSRRPQAVLWGQNNLSPDKEHTVVINNAFGSPVNVDAFIVEQSEAPASSVPSFAQGPEGQINNNSKGDENNPGLIAGLTISAFVVGMLFAFLVCYVYHSRCSLNGDKMGGKSRGLNATILPYITPNISRNPSPQTVIPWEADYHSERRDRVGDLGGASAARSQWRQHFSRAMFSNLRSAASNRQSISSGTIMTESNFSASGLDSPTTALSPGGVTLSSYFYAPSTMPSVGQFRTSDRQSLLTN